MSISVAQLVAEIKVSGAEEAKSQLKEVGETAESSGHSLRDALSFAAGQAIFNLAAQGFQLLKDQLLDTVKVAMQHQQIEAQTVQALKSTRDASGETAKSIEQYAAALSQTTPFSEDTIQSGENLLLTFTNIGKNVFPQATQAILDVSQAMGQDLKSSAVQVGKALDDPAKGMAALQRIGVTFDSEQQKLIKTYMQHGETAKAQTLILQELEKEFGGSAQAAGQTFGGQLQILNNKFDDLKIKVGTEFFPVLSNLLGFVSTTVLPELDKFNAWFVPFISNLVTSTEKNTTFRNIVSDVGSILQSTGNTIGKVIDVGEKLVSTVLKNIDSHGQLDDILKTTADIFSKVGDEVQQVGSYVEQNLIPPIGDLISNVSTTVDNVMSWIDQSGILQGTLDTLGNVIFNTTAFVGDLVGWISDLIGFLQSSNPAADALRVTILGIGTAIGLSKVGDFAKSVFDLGQKGLDAASHIGDLVSSIKDKLGGAISKFIGADGPNMQKALKSNVQDEADKASSSVSSIGSSAKTAETEVSTATKTMATDVTLVGDDAAAASGDIEAMGPAATTAETEAVPALTKIGSAAQTAFNLLGLAIGAASVAEGISSSLGYPNPGAIPVGGPGTQATAQNAVGILQHFDLGSVLRGILSIFGGHAEGGTNLPGGWSWVGEKGPELMYVPQGADIVPNHALNSFMGGGQQIIVQAPPIYLDGHLLAMGLQPYLVDGIRYATGVHI